MTSPAPPRTTLVEDERSLLRVVDRALAAPVVALDTEANGLFAFQARLCVVQLAWSIDGVVEVAIVDPRATPVAALAPLLGEAGPVKLLHDLTFDARILAEAGLRLARVRDTEVAARLLGRKALGLASLLAEELGFTLSKALQRHDWSRRPLGREHLAYLAGDVAHLHELDRRLAAHVDALDLGPEVAEETAYKLAAALAPEGDARPAWSRVKGASELDPASRAVLRRLVEVRERVAEERDVPPFHVMGPTELCMLAATRPRGASELTIRINGRARLDGRLVAALLGAIAAGLEDGDVPPGELATAFPSPPPRSVTERKRRVEQAIGAWRRREAARRGWNEQAVLPGHCARDLGDAMLASTDDASLDAAVPHIRGLGARRIGWFGDAWRELGRALRAPEPRPAEPDQNRS